MAVPVMRFIGESFNTQPPEGGWLPRLLQKTKSGSFNTQPPEGGWKGRRKNLMPDNVSTHSRLKAAGSANGNPDERQAMFQHTAA